MRRIKQPLCPNTFRATQAMLHLPVAFDYGGISAQIIHHKKNVWHTAKSGSSRNFDQLPSASLSSSSTSRRRAHALAHPSSGFLLRVHYHHLAATTATGAHPHHRSHPHPRRHDRTPLPALTPPPIPSRSPTNVNANADNAFAFVFVCEHLRVTLTLLLPSLRPCPCSELPERAEATRTAQLCAPCHLFLAFAFAECAETTARIVPPYLSPLPHTLTVSHALIHLLAGPDVLDSQFNHSIYDYENK